MKEVTRYENTLNTVPMRQWTVEEQNIFFSILTQLRDEKQKEFIWNKSDLKEMSDFSARNNDRFEVTMTRLLDKIVGIYYKERTSNSYAVMPLFGLLEAKWTDDKSDLTLKIAVSERFEYILNNLTENYTQLLLPEFLALRSSYAKTMYRHIKQWRTKGVIGGYPNGEIPKEELFILLDVPNSVKRPTNFNNRVLKPIINELSPLFEGLKVKAIKARKAGNPIIAYKFTWKQEKTETWSDGKYNKENGKTVKPAPEWSKSKPPTKASEQERKDFEAYKEARRQAQKTNP